jgi:uncharacterized protein
LDDWPSDGVSAQPRNRHLGNRPGRGNPKFLTANTLGGATGLAGIAAVIWRSLRGWTPPEQRATFQPAGVAIFAMTAARLGGANTVGADTLWVFLLGLPALALGTWAGLKLSGKLDDQAFHRVGLILLLLSGLSLLVLGR